MSLLYVLSEYAYLGHKQASTNKQFKNKPNFALPLTKLLGVLD